MAPTLAPATETLPPDEIHVLPAWWDWADGFPDASLQMRAMIIFRDRVVAFLGDKWRDMEPEFGFDEDGLFAVFYAKPQRITQDLADVASEIQVELDALPQLGSAECPCGCKADLAVRDCFRQRYRENAGIIHAVTPAELARNSVAPQCKDLGVLGWRRDAARGVYAIACVCGGIHFAGYKDVNVKELGAGGGVAEQVIRKAILEAYQIAASSYNIRKAKEPEVSELVERAGLGHLRAPSLDGLAYSLISPHEPVKVRHPDEFSLVEALKGQWEELFDSLMTKQFHVSVYVGPPPPPPVQTPKGFYVKFPAPVQFGMVHCDGVDVEVDE